MEAGNSTIKGYRVKAREAIALNKTAKQIEINVLQVSGFVVFDVQSAGGRVQSSCEVCLSNGKTLGCEFYTSDKTPLIVLLIPSRNDTFACQPRMLLAFAGSDTTCGKLDGLSALNTTFGLNFTQSSIIFTSSLTVWVSLEQMFKGSALAYLSVTARMPSTRSSM